MTNTFKTLVLSICIFISAHAHATVGGPTLVYSLSYNPQDESIYFLEHAQNGRGCPPELKKISLNTGKVDTVFSCDKAETLSSYDQAEVEIKKLTAGFKPLTQLNLKENNIAVDVTFSKNKSTEYPEIKEFRADVFQNNAKLATATLTGCTVDQPFTFGGYAIPGFNAKIILLSSAKKDCFEGGYIGEQVFMVGGLSDLQKDFTPVNAKEPLALPVSKGTITVFESDMISAPATSTATATEPVVSTTTPAETKNSSSVWLMIGIGVIALVLGVVAGSASRKK